MEQSGCKRVSTTAGFNSFPGNSETSKSNEASCHEKIGSQIENLLALQSEPLGGTRVKDSPLNTGSKKVRMPDLALMKERGERIVMLTAYDATMAKLLDRAGIDTAIKAGDADTADLFTEVSRGIDKLLWLVEAHAQATD